MKPVSDWPLGAGAVGKAIIAHYGYTPQRKGLAQTDVLQRYRSLANDLVGGYCTTADWS